MTIIYRIFSLVINAVALVMVMCLLTSIGFVVWYPITLLLAFVVLSVVLYCWFSMKFQWTVLRKQQPAKKSLRDYIRVNGLVAWVFSIILPLKALLLVGRPEKYTLTAMDMGFKELPENLSLFFVLVSVYGCVLFVHVNWTFLLLVKNRLFFGDIYDTD